MSHTRAVSLMVLVTLLWSIAGVVARQLDAAQSFEVTFWRSLFNAIALTVALTALRGARLWRDLAHASLSFWLSGLCWAVMFTAFMVAITLTTVANVLVSMAVAPLITALFARVFLRHRLPGRTWSAIALAGMGIGWMFGREAQSGASLLGTTVALAVPLAAAVNWTLLQQHSRSEGAPEESNAPEALPRPPMQDMLPAVWVGAILSALATLPLSLPFQATAHDLALLALLGSVQLAIPCLLVVRLTRELPAPEIALLSLLEVLFGVLWAWLGAGEAPGFDTLIGGALVLGALVANEALALHERASA
ncbi:MAG: DMT family transporter [Rhodocyclaceae bacterium]